MMLDDETKQNSFTPDKTFEYKGNLFLTISWLIWSVIGFCYLAIISKTNSPLMEVIYVVSAILAVNTLNNRKYGVNNSIRFYSDFVVLPKVLGPWRFKEEHIQYIDIQEVNLIDYGNNISKDYFEIEIKTDDLSYPIFGKKLKINDLEDIYNQLCARAKVRAMDFPNLDEEESYSYSDENEAYRSKWKGYLALLALIVSGWSILGISLSTPYSNLLNGGKIFIISLLLALICTFFIIKKLKKEENSSLKKWQKYFLLGYIGIYGSIALTFSMVYLNGKFDYSPTENLHMTISSNDNSDSKKGPCFFLKVDSKGRSPSSTESSIMQYGNLQVCSQSLKGASVGDNFILKAKSGLFNEKWIFDIAKKK